MENKQQKLVFITGYTLGMIMAYSNLTSYGAGILSGIIFTKYYFGNIRDIDISHDIIEKIFSLVK
jgi:hypothetical protein